MRKIVANLFISLDGVTEDAGPLPALIAAMRLARSGAL